MTSASASASEAELARLPGEVLVDRLRATYLRADFDAVARILKERDSRMVELEAALDAAIERERAAADAKAALEAVPADFNALQNRYETPRDAHRRPRDGDGDEDEELALLVGVAAPDPVHRDESRVEEAKEGEVKGPDFIDLCSDDEEEEQRAVGPCKEEEERAVGPCKGEEDSDEDEEDTELLSQRWKRLRRGEPVAVESGKGDGQGQSFSVGTLGNDQQISLSARMEGQLARTPQTVSTPEDSQVAAFVQARGIVKREKLDVEMPRTVMLSSSGLERSAVQKGKSTSIQVKTERSSLPSTITRHWESEGHMVVSFLDSMELSAQAVCSLHRQGKLVIENARLSKSDACRATKLAEILLGGDLQGPPIRTAQELENLDACFLQKVALNCSEQLFNIYRNKEDPYFC